MISSLRVSVERFTRQPDGSWNFTAKTSLEDSLDLQSVGSHLLLADLYEKIDFAPSEPGMRSLTS